MKWLCSWLVIGLGGLAWADESPSLRVGTPFPIIELPRSDRSGLESILDYRGKKLMVHVFAGW